MKKKKCFFRNLHNRVRAGTLAFVTAFLAVAGSVGSDMLVNASSSSTLTETYTFSAANGVQTFKVKQSGKYTIELAGGAGGDAGHFSSQPSTYHGGRGGLVEVTLDLAAGQTLYLYVGAMGRSDGDTGYTTATGNGTTSHGGSAAGNRVASGGGATEIRLNGTDRGNVIAVAGGGGGANQAVQNKGVNGLDAAVATAGNNGNMNGTGSSAGNNGAGGGGGYIGGTAGTSSQPAHGGSNYIAPTLTVNRNGVNSERTGGYIVITRLSSYQLMVDPNGGTFRNSPEVSTFTLDTTYSSVKSFGFNGGRSGFGAGVNGSPQAYTVPYTGYYYIEAWGASGGKDATTGGNGGYVKSYTYLTAGQTLYVNIGGHGGDNVPMDDASDGNSAGWNGGARPGANGDHNGYSGGGGGATSIATTNRGVLSNFSNHKNEVLVVAGGGSGGSASSPGTGGEVLYAGTGTNYTCVQGSGYAHLLCGAFGQGQNPGSNDGGGGGGGWIGGRRGLDAGGNSSGGGASFVNTSNSSICVGLTGNNHAGDGAATISYKNDMVVLQNPVREGYRFVRWEKSGPGEVFTTQDGSTAFTYAEGLTTLTAVWEKLPGYGTLKIDPAGGYYADSPDPTVVNKPANTQYGIAVPYKYGYTFNGWGFAGGGAYGNSVYTFASDAVGTVKASYGIAATNLTIDPNGGEYKGSTAKELHSNLTVNSGAVPVGVPTRTGYIFQYWEEIYGSDGYVGPDGWHAGTKDGYLRAVWEPITYTVRYHPNCPEGLTLTGSQPDQLHTYDQAKALAVNAEYNDPTGFKIPNVKFLWWNTKPDGSGKIYKSGEVVMNLTATQGDVINLYAQWMVTYTINHHTQNLDGTWSLRDTNEYKLVPLTKWNVPLHDYRGWYPSGDLVNEVAPYTAYPGYKDGYYPSQSKEIVIATTDTTLDFYYPLVHYNLSYDLKGGEWFEEQSDGSWIAVAAPPNEYTVLTPDIRVTRPDKVGFTYLGYTGTEVPDHTIDVVIPKGSLGDRSYTAHWEAQAYEVDIPVSVLFSVAHNGDASGMFDQNGDNNLTLDGYVTNHSLFPVQTTSLTLESTGDFTFTHDKTLDETHPDIMNWRLDVQNGGEWNQYAPELLSGINTANNDIFWMAQNSRGNMKLNVNNAWAIHGDFDIKEPMKIGRIVYTFDIGHRLVRSRSVN